MHSEYLNNFDVLLFDMGKTIMFECDRFNEHQDYEESYRKLGGKNLDNQSLHKIIYYIYGTLLERSRNNKFYDNMITVDELIETDSYFSAFSDEDKSLIERVFAYHECGIIPVSIQTTLKKLSNTHKLGLISNVWCKSHYFVEQLKTDNIYDLFDIVIYSSDYNTVKPSQKIFNIAINHFKLSAERMIYIGDNYKRDVVGSKNAGMKSILVKNSESGIISGEIQPDWIISSVEQLAAP